MKIQITQVFERDFFKRWFYIIIFSKVLLSKNYILIYSYSISCYRFFVLLGSKQALCTTLSHIGFNIELKHMKPKI